MKTLLLMMFVVLSLSACGNTPGPVGPAGPVGPSGAQGPQGAPGANGSNGSNGTNGLNIIVPCGWKDGVKNEFLFVLSDGSLTKECCHDGHCDMSKVLPGAYVTQDDKQCAYTVNADNTVTW